jgi:hypothetical protein
MSYLQFYCVKLVPTDMHRRRPRQYQTFLVSGAASVYTQLVAIFKDNINTDNHSYNVLQAMFIFHTPVLESLVNIPYRHVCTSAMAYSTI